MGVPSVDVVSVVRRDPLPLSPNIATRTTTAMIAIASADPIQPSTIPVIAIPRPPWAPPDLAIRRLATYPKISARTDTTPEPKKAKTAIVRHTIPRTIDAIARPLLRTDDPYGGGADGGGP